MFYLSQIERTFRLPPSLLNLPIEVAIEEELEKNFLDKVIANLGLCVSVYDVKSIEGGFIFPSDGAVTYTVFLILYLLLFLFIFIFIFFL
ncbi:dna-directed rna polymerase iii subunit rpc8 [Quercus suber]|uniref:DNA-directed RNA polymerase subunit n=1 Tax=Quercus suber TaxID=58331 RepID=A0AAW0JCY1_QUESU